MEEYVMRICDLPPFSLDEDGKAILLFDDTFVRTKERVLGCDWAILSNAEVKKNPMHRSRYVFYCSNTFIPKLRYFKENNLKMGFPYYIQSKKDFDALVASYQQFEYDRKMDRLERKMEEDWKKIDEEKAKKASK